MGTRSLVAIHAMLMFAMASSAALAQERGDARGTSRTVTACVALESDYVRSATPGGDRTGATALVLTDVSSGRPLLNVTGPREADLSSHVGRRVEIAGTVEPPRTTPVLTAVDGSIAGSVAGERPAAAGVTPDGAAAHEPSDALAGSVAAQTAPQPTGVDDPAYVLGLLPALRATSYRQVEGACVPAAAETARAASPAATTAPSPATPALARAPQEPAVLPIAVRGCLVRQTAGGTALTPQEKSTDPLVLADAMPVADAGRGAGGAVPGSGRSDTNSGTLPETRTTSGEAPVDASTISYQLVMSDAQRAELAPRVGERVEVRGEIARPQGGVRTPPADAQSQAGPDAERAPADIAHVSTPAQRLTVHSFRAVGGTCH